MSLYPAFFGARKRKQEEAAPEEMFAPEPITPEPEDDPDALPVFQLVPPEPVQEEPPPEPQPPPLPQGRDVHTIGISDLTRLAIDNDGRLYWDGKPVEVSRRIQMSRRQILGATLIAAFVAIGALGAAIQGASAAHDWACRLGWSSSYCGPVSQSSSNIPS
jgi:hypothetical protein